MEILLLNRLMTTSFTDFKNIKNEKTPSAMHYVAYATFPFVFNMYGVAHFANILESGNSEQWKR